MWYKLGLIVREVRERDAGQQIVDPLLSIRQTGRMLHAASGLHR